MIAAFDTLTYKRRYFLPVATTNQAVPPEHYIVIYINVPPA